LAAVGMASIAVVIALESARATSFFIETLLE
jgi:hypothetical protein